MSDYVGGVFPMVAGASNETAYLNQFSSSEAAFWFK